MLKMTIFFLLCTLLGPFSMPVHAAETGAGNDEPVETEAETSTIRQAGCPYRGTGGRGLEDHRRLCLSPGGSCRGCGDLRRRHGQLLQ